MTEETVTVTLTYDVRQYYTRKVTRQELIDVDFDVNKFFADENDLFTKLDREEFRDCSESVEVDEESQALFDSWEASE